MKPIRQIFLLACIVGVLPTGGPSAQAQAPASVPPDSLPWWNQTVFYQVFVRSFADASSGPLACDGVGDLQGLIERLDYLNDGDPSTTDDLGVTGLWLMPIMESPSYHGYDIVDYRTIEEDYGTNEDFHRLVEEARRRGIHIIIDFVLNHTSDAHSWFAEAAEVGRTYRDWYIWRDEDPEYLGPWDQRVWHERVGEYYYGVFGPHMPDLDYENPAVTEAVHELTRFWLEEMGVDGFRLDAIRHLIEDGPVQENTEATHAWLQDYYAFYKNIDPKAMTVGEVWDETENVVPYITNDELDLAFEFSLADTILEALHSGEAASLENQALQSWRLFPPHQYATFLRNHDQNRVLSDLRGERDKARAAATILLTLPGVPFLYYGEEIGMTGTKPDPEIRTPMQWTATSHAGFSECEPWQPVNDGYEAVNVETEAADLQSLLNLYRRLIHLRNEHPALQAGAYVPVTADAEPVYAFLRTTDEETLLVVVNLGAEPVRRYRLALDESPLRGAVRVTEALQEAEASAPKLDRQGGFTDYRPIRELAPRTGYVIRLTANR